MLFHEPGQELSGIRPRRCPARFPALQGCKGQIEEMRPEKGHRFGLGKPVALTPEKKELNRLIVCLRWRSRPSLHIGAMMQNEKPMRKKNSNQNCRFYFVARNRR